MAVTGRLISSRFPFLPLTLTVGNRRGTFEALLDTGFNGDVSIPPGIIADDQLPSGYLGWTLADGSRVETPAYRGVVQVGGFRPFGVTVIVLGDEVIVGRGITDRFTVILDHGTRLIVEP